MANQEILAVTYGLASASFWGTSDFSGGFVTKTTSVFGVLLIANITGTVLLTICALWAGSPVPDTYSLIFGAFAGIAGLIGLAAFYKGLASEHMGMVASLAALISAALPVLFGMLIEGFPSNRQIAGFAAASGIGPYFVVVAVVNAIDLVFADGLEVHIESPQAMQVL